MGYQGQVYTIKKSDSTANTLTIKDPNGKMINASSSIVLNQQNEAVVLIYSGTKWINFMTEASSGGSSDTGFEQSLMLMGG